jgi:hypothetical protein
MFPRGAPCPAKNAGCGNSCRVKWANNSTFHKRGQRKTAENQGKYWFTPAQRDV